MNNDSSITSILCALSFMVLMSLAFVASAVRVVPEEKRLKVYRLGRDIGLRGPGLVMLIPVIDRGVLTDAGGQIVPAQKPAGPQHMVGVARTSVFRDGKVLLGDQVWAAVSERPIAAGQRVRVRRVLVEVDEVQPDGSG